MMHQEILIPAVLAVLILAAACTAYLVPRLRGAPAPSRQLPALTDREAATTVASSDAVMRALSLVQQQYAALVRRYDAADQHIRDLEAENHRLKVENDDLRGRVHRP